MIRIIIADDEELIRKRLIKCIPWEELGYEIVAVAEDGDELLNQIETKNADVVLTDIKMSGMDGLDVISCARGMGYSDTQFVIISGYSDFEYARKGIEVGVFDYILKPIDKDKLIACFKKLAKKIPEIKKQRIYAEKEEDRDELRSDFILDKGMENMIERFINEKNFEGIKTTFKELPLESLTYNNCRIVCFLYINMIYRILNSQGVVVVEEKNVINSFLNEFEKCERINTMRICTSGCIDKIIELLSENFHGQKKENYIIRKAMIYIDENLDKDISLRDVSDNLEVSYGYISRLFNMPNIGGFSSILRKKRLELAKRLLQTTNMKVYEVAFATGFKNGRYFSEVFKNETGLMPKEYRNKYFGGK